jgi:L-aminopeptidase/D-esterase-like protein
VLLATDAPLDARQLTRVARRAAAGLARTGSDYGHGSGDIALAFSTAPWRVPQQADEPMPAVALLHEAALDGFFQAAAEATEQAILHACSPPPWSGERGAFASALALGLCSGTPRSISSTSWSLSRASGSG